MFDRRGGVSHKPLSLATKIVLGVFATFLLIFGCVAGYFYQTTWKPFNDQVQKEILLPKTAVLTHPAEDKDINILVVGVDERGEDKGRTDTIIVASINNAKKTIRLLSVPRDTRVPAPTESKYDKINHTYSYGGIDLTKRTVESFLGIKIDSYVLVNFGAFKQIVDSVGGVEIAIENDMEYEDPYDVDGGLVIDLHPGVQTLSGNTALHFVRYRSDDGDIGRIKRQQQFLKATMAKVFSVQNISKIPTLIQHIYSNIRTDMLMADIMKNTSYIMSPTDFSIVATTVPGYPVTIDELSYWVPDYKKTKEIVETTLQIKSNIDINNISDKFALEVAKHPEMAENSSFVSSAKTVSALKTAVPQKTDLSEFHVRVINASGIQEYEDNAVSQLENAGFSNIDISQNRKSSSGNTFTLIIIETDSDKVIGQLKSLPFHFGLIKRNRQGNVKPDAEITVIVGKDYRFK